MSIKVQGLDKAIKALEKYDREVVADTVKAMNTAMINVHSEAVRKAPTNDGRLKSSIVMTRAKQSDLTSKVIVNANYAPYVEFGTKSKVDIPQGLEQYALQFKASGGNFADLLDSIELWARKKGIPQEAAYPIARKIANEGVSAQPFLFPAWEKERPKFEKAVKELLQR
jgi:HK97 gp10 family phage protein